MSTPSLNKQATSAVSPAPGVTISAEEQSGKAAVDSGHGEHSQAEAAVVEAGMSAEPTASESLPTEENLFHSAPSRPAILEEEEAEPSYEEPAEQELVHPPDFRPFFALVEDPDSGEHHHPTVHYVFSDDDPDVITSASLEAMELPTASSYQHTAVEERMVILDIAADGKTVSSASSLVPQWQAVQATVSQAPSWGDNAPAMERGLMLKISGQEAVKPVAVKDKKATLDGLEDLARTFSSRLAVLDQVLGPDESTSFQDQTQQTQQ